MLKNYLFILGGISMLIGAIMPLFITMQPYAPTVFTLGAILFATMQIQSRYEGHDPVIRRLRRQQVLGALVLVATGGMMWMSKLQIEPCANDEWKLGLAIGIVGLFNIQFIVDAEENVLSVEALNGDAEKVLGNMELKDTSLEVAVNAIIGSMLQKGYLGDLQNTILVSVENEDAAQGEVLQQKVTEAIANAVQNSSLDAAVLSQSICTDDAVLAAKAAEYHISLGKAVLIQEVIAQVPTLTFEDLAPMSINEIALITVSKNVSIATVTQSGAASNKAYISQEKALNVVYNHAGMTMEDVIEMEIEFDSKHGTLVYEVEFETATKEGEYEIDAVTGEILKSELKNRDNAEVGFGYIGAAAAKETALAHAGVTAGDILEIKIELDSDDHIMIYHVEFETGTKKYAYKIHAVTGAVVTSEAKDQKNGTSKNNSSSVSSGNSSYIGEAAAKKAALSHAGVAESNTAYIKCYLEYEDGKPAYYCVEFKVDKTEYEYEIDLYSGTVLDCEVENHSNSEKP